MSREAHAGICERRGVGFPPATQLGDFKAVGREWAPSGEPAKVNTHDFPSHAEGKGIPYGIYDLACDVGWISVGVSRDSAQFAAASILAWWQQLGCGGYPDATTLTITADSGGSNSARGRLWKTDLQKLADQTGLMIRVLHSCRARANGTASITARSASPATAGAASR